MANPTHARRDQACRELADAHAFIEEMPDGYDTLVGDRGMSLSGASASALPLPAIIRDTRF